MNKTAIKVKKLRRKTVFALKKMFVRNRRTQNQQLSLDIAMNTDYKVDTNIYVTFNELNSLESEEIKFKRDISGNNSSYYIYQS